MRRLLGATLVVAAALSITGMPASAEADDHRALLTQDGWWDEPSPVVPPTVGDALRSVLDLTAPLAAPLPDAALYRHPAVPLDTIAVATAVTDRRRVAAIGIDVPDTPAMPLTALRLTLVEIGEGSAGDLDGARVVACAITEPWTPTIAGDEGSEPRADCALGTVAASRTADHRWIFDLTPLLPLWQGADPALAPNGVLLQIDPAAPPSEDVQVTFADLSTGTAQVEAAFAAGPPAPVDIGVSAPRVGPAEVPDAATVEVPAVATDAAGAAIETAIGRGAAAPEDAAPAPGPPEELAVAAPHVDVHPVDGSRRTSGFRIVPLVLLAGVIVLSFVLGARGAIRAARAGARSLRSRRVLGTVTAAVLIVPPPSLLGALNAAASRAIAVVTSPLVEPVERLPDLPPSTRVLDRHGQEVAPFGEVRRVPVRLESLPDHVWQAVLAAEDSTFFDHAGVDPTAMVRATVRSLSGTVQGGSTIVQQLVKLNYLGDEHSLMRKLEEVPYAARLGEMYSKDELLERYLNQVYFGDGAYGIGAAALEYFGVPAEQLDPAQAALLAGKIRSPVGLDPRHDPATVRARRNQVLGLMHRSGWLRRGQFDHWQSTSIDVTSHDGALTQHASHFVQYVRREVADLDTQSAPDGALVAALESGGHTIETTLDQQALAAAVSAVTEVLGAPGEPATAIASVEPGDGAIRVLLSGLDPTDEFDVASQGRRAPGDALAPLAVVAALESGVVIDAGSEYAGRDLPAELRAVAARLGIDDPDLVNPLDVAAAYATFAAEGIYARPYAISRILDRDGRVVYQHGVERAQVIHPDVARSASSVLRTSGAGASVALGRAVAGRAAASAVRTDAWFAGYVPQLATVVWIGVPECSVPVPGLDPDAPADAWAPPANVFAAYMGRALHGLPVVDLPPAGAPLPRPAAVTGTRDPGPVDPTPSAIRAAVLAALRTSTAADIAVAVDIEGLGTVVDINGSAPLAPASTQKLYLAGAALLRLGVDHRFRTEVRATAPPDTAGIVHGALVLTGSGDPTLSGSDLAELAQAVAGAGIRRVTGTLYLDAAMAPSDRMIVHAMAADVPSTLGPLAPLAVDGNRWRCDDAFLADPVTGNGERFEALLAGAGVTVDGPVSVRSSPGADEVVAAHESAPLADVIGGMMRRSDSFAAELLLRELGRSAGRPDGAGGLAVLSDVAADLGVAPAGWADGSGLSKRGRDTARHQVEWLARMEATPVAGTFYDSLAVACETGTLEHRFCNTPAAGRVHAKTGNLQGTVNLAGYTETPSGRTVRFSFLLSGVRSRQDAQLAVDRAVTALASGQLAVVSQIHTAPDQIFLTVDDGWVRDWHMVDLVRRLGVPLTVFPTAAAVEADPAYSQALLDAGASVQNHTVTHPVLPQQTYDQQVAELCDANTRLGAALGVRPTLVRPPFGAFADTTRAAAAACGLDTVLMWSAEMHHGNLTARDDRLRGGDIVLLHFDEHLYDDLVRVLELAEQSGLTIGNLEEHLAAGFPPPVVRRAAARQAQ